MFHQLEGLHIDKNINMGHLKGCLNYFVKEFFEVEKLKCDLDQATSFYRTFSRGRYWL